MHHGDMRDALEHSVPVVAGLGMSRSSPPPGVHQQQHAQYQQLDHLLGSPDVGHVPVSQGSPYVYADARYDHHYGPHQADLRRGSYSTTSDIRGTLEHPSPSPDSGKNVYYQNPYDTFDGRPYYPPLTERINEPRIVALPHPSSYIFDQHYSVSSSPYPTPSLSDCSSPMSRSSSGLGTSTTYHSSPLPEGHSQHHSHTHGLGESPQIYEQTHGLGYDLALHIDTRVGSHSPYDQHCTASVPGSRTPSLEEAFVFQPHATGSPHQGSYFIESQPLDPHSYTPTLNGSPFRRLSLAEISSPPHVSPERRNSTPHFKRGGGASSLQRSANRYSPLVGSPPRTPRSPDLDEEEARIVPPESSLIIFRRPPESDFVDGANVRTQKLRFDEDHYTPLWVRGDGHSREGWCALCPGDEGKWLQLKNSAFWYHRQFQHGVSSVSGHYFLPPLKTRPAASGDKTEGLCPSCGEWALYSNNRPSTAHTKVPTLWYRHAHSCHSYFSPKREASKQARLSTKGKL